MKIASPVEFAEGHAVDSDWVAAMVAAGQNAAIYEPGEAIIYSGHKGYIDAHYRNGMYNIRLPGGRACVGASELQPA